MANPKHRFLNVKDLFAPAALVLLNGVIAIWLQQHYSTFWSWEILSPQDHDGLSTKEYAVLAQLSVLGFSLDGLLRILVKDINRSDKKVYIPKILVQVCSLLIYGLIGLFGAIKLYDLPIRSLVAASGLISVILAYSFRELIADILASAQIQINRIARIGDWIYLKHNDEMITAKVIDLDQQIITLQDTSKTTRLIRNSHFLHQTIVNYSSHKNTAVRNAEIELSSRLPHTEVTRILEYALDYVSYTNKQFDGDYHARVKNLSQGNLKFSLEYRCHPSVSYGDSSHIVINAALRFLKCAGFDLTPPQSQSNSSFEIPTRVPHRLLQAKEFGILRSLSTEETQFLENKISITTLDPLQNLLTKGELKNCIYIVAEGILSIEQPSDNEGKSIELAKSWPGDVIGEMSLLTGEPHSANITAVTNVSLITIANSDIEPLLRKSPQLTQAIVDQVLQRKQANELILHHQVDQSERKNLLKRVFDFLGI